MTQFKPAARTAACALCVSWLTFAEAVAADAAEAPRDSGAQGETRSNAAPPPPPRGRQRVEELWSHRTLDSRLAVHDPIYFIAGNEAPEIKFQLSFKYRVATFGGVEESDASHTLQFAYSQRTLWAFGAQSSPFYDTSYMPELLYQFAAPQLERFSGSVSWLGLQTGLGHESNGRAEPMSRSMNRYLIRAAFAIGDPDDWYVLLTPTLYTYIFDLDENPDLRNYRDDFELRAVLARSDKQSLTFTWIPGNGLSGGSRQLDLWIPVRISAINFATFVQVQYFEGYGESLLSYDNRSSSLRIGLALVR